MGREKAIWESKLQRRCCEYLPFANIYLLQEGKEAAPVTRERSDAVEAIHKGGHQIAIKAEEEQGEWQQDSCEGGHHYY